LREKSHLKVLMETADVTPYVNEHLAELRMQNRSDRADWIINEHNKKFTKWFKDKIKFDGSMNETMLMLAKRPSLNVVTHQGFNMHGFTWYTKKQDKKSTVQNSGVTIEALSVGGGKSVPYYDRIEQIWELDY
jgi:uncharacterized protein with von Willebrand factor type A (vWA) domain